MFFIVMNCSPCRKYGILVFWQPMKLQRIVIKFSCQLLLLIALSKIATVSKWLLLLFTKERLWAHRFKKRVTWGIHSWFEQIALKNMWFALVALHKRATVRNFFLSLIALLLTKNEWFAQNTEEQIPKPYYFCNRYGKKEY